MNEFEIEIPNWAKHQHRKELKKMTWFRVEGDLFFDSKFGSLSVNSKLFWVYLLSEACRTNAERVKFSATFAAKHSGLRVNLVRKAVDDLEQLQLIKVIFRNENDTYRTRQNITNRTRQDSSKAPLTKHENGAKVVEPTSQNLPKITTKTESKTAATWESFSNAYRKRYGSEPVRNATTNSQMSNFVKRIGEEESPKVAEFYLSLTDQFYLNQCHAVGILLRDSEKLRTMWAGGIRNTKVDAKTAHWRDQARLIQEGEL